MCGVGCVFAAYLKLLSLFLLTMPRSIAKMSKNLLLLSLLIISGMIRSSVCISDEIACSDPDICEAVCRNRHGCSDIAYPLLVMRLMPAGKIDGCRDKAYVSREKY